MKDYLYGNGALVQQGLALDGYIHRLIDMTGAIQFDVDPAIDAVIIYRMTQNTNSGIKVETMTCNNSADEKIGLQAYEFPNTSTTQLWSQSIIVPVKTCKTVKITRNISAGAHAVVERITLLNGSPNPLPIGTYDNLAIADRFINGVLLINPLASEYDTNPDESETPKLHTWHQFNNATANLTFTVYTNPNDVNDPNNVKRIAIYRQLDMAVDAYGLRVSLSGGASCTPPVNPIDISSYIAELPVWQQSYTILLNGCTTVTISRANATGTAPGIDKIEYWVNQLRWVQEHIMLHHQKSDHFS